MNEALVLSPTQSETELTPHQQNEFERIVADNFPDDVWSANADFRLHDVYQAGLAYQKDAEGELLSDAPLVQIDKGRAWMSLAYGSRIIEQPGTDEVIVETVDLPTMVTMHAKLAETVLKGENAHASVLITELPEPELGLRSLKNNDVWLKTIADGNWPIMPDAFDDEGKVIAYEMHDQADAHTGNFLLLPREVQDLATRAAGLEYEYRQKAARGETPKINDEHVRVVLLPGEDLYDNDPFGSGSRGQTLLGEPAIMKIDNITENRGYLNLLNFITSGDGTSPTAQMEQLSTYRQKHQDTNGIGSDHEHPLYRFAVTANLLERQVGDLVNFISRSENRRNTTQDEIDQANQTLMRGIVRVAEKINGTYVWSEADDDVGSPQQLPEATTATEETVETDEVVVAPSPIEWRDPFAVTGAERELDAEVEIETDARRRFGHIRTVAGRLVGRRSTRL